MSFWVPSWVGQIPRLSGQPSAAAQMPDAAKPGPVLPVVSSVAAAPIGHGVFGNLDPELGPMAPTGPILLPRRSGRPKGSKNKAKA